MRIKQFASYKKHMLNIKMQKYYKYKGKKICTQ